jgi:acyl-CoA reductase-like NAD-dependent aldehyde dehydrogenase
VYDKYLDEFVNEVKSWKIGKPEEAGVYIGPLTRKDQMVVLERQVTQALDKGAKLVHGGKRIDGKGYYFEPTILVDVNNSMNVMREESFGPIIGIMKVRSDDEAVALMQDTEYGLTAGVYSASQQRAENIIQRIVVTV